jgi:hypothetical protein
MNVTSTAIPALLNPVDRLCFDRHKFDYSDGFAEPRILRRLDVQIALRGIGYGMNPDCL